MSVRAVALIVAAGALACTATSRQRFDERGFLFREMRLRDRTYPYAVYVPRGYDPGLRWPLILFLHGRGESGTDGVTPLIQGIGSAIQWHSERWPAIVLFPQKPTADSEWEQHEEAVLAILDAAMRAYSIDGDRVYLTGLSQGGHGTWVLGARHRGRWAALVSVCAYASAHPRSASLDLPPPSSAPAEALASGLADLPIWIFHGDADETVPVSQALDMERALRALGREPRVTIFPGVKHNSWDLAFRDEALPAWLLAQRRGPPR